MKRVHVILLTATFAAMFTFFLLAIPWSLFDEMGASMSVTTLDRARVINHKILEDTFPELAKNSRNDVARYITAGFSSHVRTLIYAGLFSSGLGLAVALSIPIRQKRG